MAGCSFGFTVPDGGDRWEQRSGTFLRELLRVDLREITLTSDPAYTDTTVALRSLDKITEYNPAIKCCGWRPADDLALQTLRDPRRP